MGDTEQQHVSVDEIETTVYAGLQDPKPFKLVIAEDNEPLKGIPAAPVVSALAATPPAAQPVNASFARSITKHSLLAPFPLVGINTGLNPVKHDELKIELDFGTKLPLGNTVLEPEQSPLLKGTQLSARTVKIPSDILGGHGGGETFVQGLLSQQRADLLVEQTLIEDNQDGMAPPETTAQLVADPSITADTAPPETTTQVVADPPVVTPTTIDISQLLGTVVKGITHGHLGIKHINKDHLSLNDGFLGVDVSTLAKSASATVKGVAPRYMPVMMSYFTEHETDFNVEQLRKWEEFISEIEEAAGDDKNLRKLITSNVDTIVRGFTKETYVRIMSLQRLARHMNGYNAKNDVKRLFDYVHECVVNRMAVLLEEYEGDFIARSQFVNDGRA